MSSSWVEQSENYSVNVLQNTWYYLEIDVINKSSYRIYLDGKYIGTFSPNSGAQLDIKYIMLGDWMYAGNVYTNQFYGIIYDFTIYDGNLHTTEDSYIISKYPNCNLNARILTNDNNCYGI